MKKQDAKTSPPVKVVGFRVEGATPSPRDTSLADVGAASTVTGSPSPVIIPPAFAVRTPLSLCTAAALLLVLLLMLLRLLPSVLVCLQYAAVAASAARAAALFKVS